MSTFVVVPGVLVTVVVGFGVVVPALSVVVGVGVVLSALSVVVGVGVVVSWRLCRGWCAPLWRRCTRCCSALPVYAGEKETSLAHTPGTRAWLCTCECTCAG